jgi:hypothetical protein
MSFPKSALLSEFGWEPINEFLDRQRVNYFARFDEKLFVFKYCFIFIVLGQDTSTPGSKDGTHRGDKGSIGGRGLTVCC